MLSVRPKIAELVFHLFGRALHPELFDVYASRVIERAKYKAEIHITSAGHVVTFRHEGMTLTEVACASNQPMPEKRRLMFYKLKGRRQDRLDCRGGCRYQTSFQLEEPVEPSVFWSFQRELSVDRPRAGLLYKFDSSGRIDLGALSFIHVESRQKSLLVQSFHTFPDDYAIVKCQSLFETP